jgi:hypothetical protein
MVAMTAPVTVGVRQLRPARDPVRPVGAWLPALLVAAGILLSLLGWATGARLDALQESADRANASAAVEQWEAAKAEALTARTASQRDALAALVVYRCDTGQITDPGLCEPAREIRR